MTFRVQLNSSYDKNPLHAEERVYPDDRSPANECTAEQVVDLVWRQGTVPEWINVSVIGVIGASTLIEVLCCGRFTANTDLLYHQREGRPPFHVLGPTLPAGHEAGVRFSVHHRSSCWSAAEVDRLVDHAHKIWALEIVGDAAIDATLHRLPALPKLEILELRDSAVTWAGLHTLSRFPKLRVLRIHLMTPGSLGGGAPPPLRSLTTVSLENLSSTPWSIEPVARAWPHLASLTLHAAGGIALHGSFRRSIDYLSITATSLSQDLRLP